MPDRPTNAPDHDPDGDAVGRLVHEAALTVQAPPALRTRLAEQERRAARPRRRWALPAALAGAGLAAVAVVALLVGGGGDPAAPSVAQAAALALARPTDPPPATDPADTTRVRAAVGDVAFPNYAYIWPKWHTAGVRRDRVGGRATVTVTYRGPAGDVGYTIIDGKPLPEPANARHVRAGGLRLAVVRRGGATVVTWRRGGHTCVLASRGRGVEPQLIRFATWA
jgi:hypothetical protein